MEYVTKTMRSLPVIVPEQVSVVKSVKLMLMIACLIPVTVMEFVVIKSMALAVNVILVMMGTIVKTISMIACLIPVTIMEFALINSMTLVVNVTLAIMGTIVKMISMNALKIHAKIVEFAKMTLENLRVSVKMVGKVISVRVM